MNARQTSTAPAGNHREFNNQIKNYMLQMVSQWHTDPLLTGKSPYFNLLAIESLKQTILDMVDADDERVMHMYRIYIPNKDFEGFKARVIHLAMRNHSEYRMSGEDRPSSMTTAGFHRSADYLSRFSRGSSAMYGQRQMRNTRVTRPETHDNNSEYGMTTDRYLPIIINLENHNMLDETTSAIIKNMILDENHEIFRVINEYIAQMVDE